MNPEYASGPSRERNRSPILLGIVVGITVGLTLLIAGVVALPQYAYFGQKAICRRLEALRDQAQREPDSPRPVEQLIAALEGEDSFERTHAAMSLGQLGTRGAPAVDPLTAAAAGQDGYVAREAVLALGRIGPPAKKAIPTLLQLISKRPDADVGWFSADSLGQIADPDDPGIAAALEQALESPNETMRSSAKQGLRSLRSRAAGPTTAPTSQHVYGDPFAFMTDYRIAHYLTAAAELQQLDPEQRATRLRELAADPQHASEVFPLCRMLFEPQPAAEFRRPRIGGAVFVGGGDYADWPLEPITFVDGVPILIVKGYMLGGFPEPPGRYVEYCLSNCRWRDAKFVPVSNDRLRESVAKFIASNPKLRADAEWLLRQAGDL